MDKGVSVEIPGWGDLRVEHLVLDYNGTIAVDGRPLPGVCERLGALAERLTVHILTADTFGRVQQETSNIPCALTILAPGSQDVAKRDYVQKLGADSVVAIGNGRNDCLMLQLAALGIAVLMDEGAAIETVSAADILVPHITAALDLFAEPERLVATLRS